MLTLSGLISSIHSCGFALLGIVLGRIGFTLIEIERDSVEILVVRIQTC